MFYFEKQVGNEIEYAISFYQGLRCYRVHGDTTLEKVEEVAMNYANVILENAGK